ncbi:transposase [Teichococcus aestuarii]|uniref:transposase n=1 Tax=Teichococcus aestuarii TaxID=568898 RepID=UPI003616B0FC
MTPAAADPDDVESLRAALAVEREARLAAEARATGAEAMITHLKLVIAKLQHDKFGASSERGRKLLDQLELELGELVATVAEDTTRAENRREPSPGHRRRAGLPAGLCLPIYRASGWWSRRPLPAPAAAASCPSLARTSPRPWR